MNTQKNSIFKKVLYNNLIITIIPLVLIMIFICFQICLSFKTTQHNNIKNNLMKTTSEYKIQIENNVQKSELILKNNDIIYNLDTDFTKHSEILNYIQISTNYIDYITISNKKDKFEIFTDNNTLYENKYFFNLDRLPNSEEIFEKFRAEKTNFIWEDEIYTTAEDEKYLVYYRNMPLNKKALMRVCVFFNNNTEINEFASLPVLTLSKNFNEKNCISENINSHFSVVTKIDETKFYKQYLIYIFLHLIIILAVIFTIVFLTTKTTLAVTSNMSDFIVRLSKKDFTNSDFKVGILESDAFELITIKNAVNDLIEKIKSETNQKFAVELEKKQLSLNLLQSNINPHLLYNSLSAIKLIAFKEKNKQIIDNIDTLVRYYRLVLSKGEKLVTLRDEINLLLEYVKINELTHSKKYEMSVNIPNELLNKKIIHILLQPLVENAILHGLSGDRENPKIEITANTQDDYLFIYIYDNGFGIEKNLLDKLNASKTYNFGYGIKNTKERISLYYGTDCGITFESVENEGTNVIVKIKISEDDFLQTQI